MADFPGQVFTEAAPQLGWSWLLNPDRCEIKVVQIDPAARDAGHTNFTTHLRSGLVMGLVTATKKWKEYDDTDADGTEVARGILLQPVRLVDPFGIAAVSPIFAPVVIASGRVRDSLLIGLDAAGESDLEAVPRCFFFEEDVE